MLTPDLDPITFEVVTNALSSAADEMALSIMRSAYSPMVRDAMDYATALCDRNGEVIAQGLTLAIQLSAFPNVMRHLLRQHGKDMRAGDVFLFNDPYVAGGQHLPDFYVIKPVFESDELQGYAATMAHQCDVGGIAPGSAAVHAVELFQEGIRLPILKLYDAGQPNETLFRIIALNTRLPVQVMGDIRAQLAAVHTGERGLLEIVARYGAEDARRYFAAILSRSEAMMRAEITALRDGSYENVDYLDGFGEAPQPIRIAVRLTIRGDEIDVDFTGSSPQVPAAINCPVSMVNSATYCAIRSIAAPDIPNCDGYMRPIHVTAPEGTIVNPMLPAAVAARAIIAFRVFDVIQGALAKVVPARVTAASDGGPVLFSIGGWSGGKPFVLTESIVNNWGARLTSDGPEGISSAVANVSNQPIELIEAEQPIEVVQYGFVPDTGGPGRFRGGLAFVREWRLLAEEATYTLRSDRRTHVPLGLAGGHNGAPSLNEFRGEAGPVVLPQMPMAGLRMRRGESFRYIGAGGGGYGPACLRDPDLVLQDVLDEKVSLFAAERDYGVAIDPGTLQIDVERTAALRRARGVQSTGTIQFGDG